MITVKTLTEKGLTKGIDIRAPGCRIIVRENCFQKVFGESPSKLTIVHIRENEKWKIGKDSNLNNVYVVQKKGV